MTAAANRKKPDSSRPRRLDRPGLVAYLNWAECRLRSLRFFENSDAGKEGEARWGLRRGDVIATIGARKSDRTGCARFVAAANGRDLPKYRDAPKVGTMTAGSSAERGKPLLRRGQTRER